MSIWKGEISLDMINGLQKGTLGENFEIEFTEIGDDYLKAVMPVQDKVRQPFGLLHGGASVAFAETLGSVASLCAMNRELFIGVGVEINANHLAQVKSGFITGVCMALKAEGKVQVWEIRITDEKGTLCCLCRFTSMVVPRPR
jgi:1,4-dihydroxy-2-naphthoyl-CoA hydrolase